MVHTLAAEKDNAGKKEELRVKWEDKKGGEGNRRHTSAIVPWKRLSDLVGDLETTRACAGLMCHAYELRPTSFAPYLVRATISKVEALHPA